MTTIHSTPTSVTANVEPAAESQPKSVNEYRPAICARFAMTTSWAAAGAGGTAGAGLATAIAGGRYASEAAATTVAPQTEWFGVGQDVQRRRGRCPGSAS